MMASVRRQAQRHRDARARAGLAISIDPCSASTLRRTTSMPTPRPETSVTSRAVEKPGARISEKISASESRADAVDQPLLDGAGAHRLHIQAASVVR